MNDLISLIIRDIPVPYEIIAKIIRTAPYRYKKYFVPKRNSSGFREIAQPAKELKVLQYWLMNNVLDRLPVHSSCIGYVKGKGIKDNALAHVNNDFILKMDFKNFFPSIVQNDFICHMNKYGNGFCDNDLYDMAKLLFQFNAQGQLVLSIGAPSSPMLSNSIMYDFDTIVYAICSAKNVVYTRYADDLTFSTRDKNVLKNIEEMLFVELSKLKYPQIAFNKSKTVHLSKKHSRRVTGLNLSSQGEVSLGREKKRYIKSLVCKYIHGEMDDAAIQKLKGYLAFANDVEPAFIIRLKNKYTDILINDILC